MKKKDKSKAPKQLTLHELNCSIISQMTPLTDEQLQAQKEIFTEFHQEKKNTFYVLCNKQFSYFTVFQLRESEESKLADEILACFENIGKISTIDKGDNGAIEIWAEYKDTVDYFAFFPYDGGIVPFGG